LKKGEVVFSMIFPADYEPSKVVQPGKEPLDFPALGVASQPSAAYYNLIGAPGVIYIFLALATVLLIVLAGHWGGFVSGVEGGAT